MKSVMENGINMTKKKDRKQKPEYSTGKWLKWVKRKEINANQQRRGSGWRFIGVAARIGLAHAGGSRTTTARW